MSWAQRTYYLLITSLLGGLILVGVESCNKYKYPEGPGFTIRSVKGRMKGTYKIESFTVNGEDHTHLVKNDTGYKHMKVATRSGNRDQLYYFLVDPETGGGVGFPSSGDLDVFGQGIYFTGGINHLLVNYPVLHYSNTEHYPKWTILRLSAKDLWIRYDDNDTVYNIKFREI